MVPLPGILSAQVAESRFSLQSSDKAGRIPEIGTVGGPPPITAEGSCGRGSVATHAPCIKGDSVSSLDSRKGEAMRHLVYLGLGVVASLLATPPAGAGPLRLDEHDSPGLALGATNPLDAPDWLVAAQGTWLQSFGAVPPGGPDDERRHEAADKLPPSPRESAADPFAAWKWQMLLTRCLPGAVFLLAAALVTRDQLLQAKL